MNAVSVSELNGYVQNILEMDENLRNISVKGEISGFKYHSSGHMYFSLKDPAAVIRCVMFRQHNTYLRFRPSDGMNVVVTGHVSIYPKDGSYQFYVAKMTNDGEGTLYQALERQKQRLLEEGLFDAEYKKEIPLFNRRIGVITSPTGAVINDIIRVSQLRFPNVSISLFPVKVQGEGAAKEITNAIEYANQHGDIDVLIVGRGGGSIEDLWVFNEECVARAIFASKIPVISAVGHETDFTIADFVADKRAATPSQAAEFAACDAATLLGFIDYSKNRMTGKLRDMLENVASRLERVKAYGSLARPRFIDEKNLLLDNLRTALIRAGEERVKEERRGIDRLRETIEALSPLSALKRGYALVTHNGNVISYKEGCVSGMDIEIKFKDGDVGAIIK